MNLEDYYVPSHLDDPPKFFIFEMDEFMAGAAPLGIGIVLKMLLFGVILGGLAAYGVQRLKAGRGRGIMMQAIYWYLPPFIFKFKRTPPSTIREYVG